MKREAEIAAALRELVRHVAYTEHWMRHTEAFANACAAVGLDYQPGKGLVEHVARVVPSPFEDGR